MSDPKTIFTYESVKEQLEEMGYTIRSSSTCFQIWFQGLMLCSPETIESALTVCQCLQVLKDKDLLN